MRVYSLNVLPDSILGQHGKRFEDTQRVRLSATLAYSNTTGGEANGTPRNAATLGCPCAVPSNPRMGPSVVFTTGSCTPVPADAECMSDAKSSDSGPVSPDNIL